MKYKCIATAAFGLEGIVAKELQAMGIEAKAELGGAKFSATAQEILMINIKLRCSDRVMLILAEKEVFSFDELFELSYSINWKEILPVNAYLPIKAKCAKSQIMSPRDCQTIVKKALVKKIQNQYSTQMLSEKGEKYSIDVSIHNNIARIALDTSGIALNKRGYRILNGEAAIRETLAATMINVSPWRQKQALYDPCCGTATFLIEAAMIALKMPPGINRSFDIEKWSILTSEDVKSVRMFCLSEYDTNRTIDISGSDIDDKALSMAKKHIQKAGLSNRIIVTNLDLNSVKIDKPEGCFIVNPPYGERMYEQKQTQKLYRDLGKLLQRHPSWSMAVISNDKNFEQYFGKKADKKRKVYNGRIECNIFIYK